MSPTGQLSPASPDGDEPFVASFTLARGQFFDWHEHSVHQLAWAERGVLLVHVSADTWVLPPSLALWLPRGTPHRTGASAPAHMRSVYLPTGSSWREPTVVAVGDLLRELIRYLAEPPLAAGARRRAEAVLFDLISPRRGTSPTGGLVDATMLRVRVPTDPRAREVAERLLAAPDDPRTLSEWAAAVVTSPRTLARLFAEETGVSFGRWRTQARLRASLPLLAAGLPVTAVAHRVGFGTPSAFAASFRSSFGTSPGAFFEA